MARNHMRDDHMDDQKPHAWRSHGWPETKRLPTARKLLGEGILLVPYVDLENCSILLLMVHDHDGPRYNKYF
jgi:hypothetical protein